MVGGFGSVANPSEYLGWGISGEIFGYRDVNSGELTCGNGDLVLYYIHMVMLDNFSIFIFCL